ncbi:MAG: hypothetical protein J7L23_02970, partial [Candidatus Diapherotrites archaeon]|nr:hypothetical protein [Candidatus Diapherotrites archaeon]
GWVYCTPTILATTVGLNWTFNSSLYPTPALTVISGADNQIHTKYGYISWTDNVNTSTKTLGPSTVNVTDPASTPYVVGYDNSSTNEGIWAKSGSSFLVFQNTSNADYDSAKYYEGNSADIEALSGSEVQFTFPENTPLTQRVALCRSEITQAVTGEATYTTEDFQDPVLNFTCVAKDYTYNLPASSVTFGTVPDDIVILDTEQPSGNAVILGGYEVNKLAKDATESNLTAAGDTYVAKDGTNVYVAGYTGQDTADAVDALIAAIKQQLTNNTA